MCLREKGQKPRFQNTSEVALVEKGIFVYFSRRTSGIFDGII